MACQNVYYLHNNYRQLLDSKQNLCYNSHMADNVDKSIESVNDLTGSVDQPAPTKRRYQRRKPKSQITDSVKHSKQASPGVVDNSKSITKFDKKRSVRAGQVAHVDVGRALELRLKGASYQEIADIQGVTKQAVNSRLAAFKLLLNDPDAVNAIDAQRDKILTAGLGKLLLATLDDRAIKRCSTLQLASSYGILFDKQRLIRGESTNNIDVRSVLQHLHASAQAIRERINSVQDDTQCNDMNNYASVCEEENRKVGTEGEDRGVGG